MFFIKQKIMAQVHRFGEICHTCRSVGLPGFHRMFSRAFFIVFPMAVIFAIIAFAAMADEERPPQDFRDAIERQRAEDIAEPDMPNPEATPEKPAPNSRPKLAPQPEHAHKMEAYVTATLTSALSPASVEKGVETKMTLMLSDKDGKPVSIMSLEERHTKRIHLLVVDDSLTDYQHIHPEAGKEEGTYTFTFTPLTSHSYRVFADVKPAGQPPQMVQATLAGAEKCADPCIDKALVERAVFDGYTAYLSLPGGALHAGTPVRGDVFITDADNAPFAKLEPVMGAYGHIVGFYENGGVAHVHPMGREPEKDTDRGSSPIAFMLHPEAAGFVKLFVQLRVDGKDVFLPFGIFIDP